MPRIFLNVQQSRFVNEACKPIIDAQCRTSAGSGEGRITTSSFRSCTPRFSHLVSSPDVSSSLLFPLGCPNRNDPFANAFFPLHCAMRRYFRRPPAFFVDLAVALGAVGCKMESFRTSVMRSPSAVLALRPSTGCRFSSSGPYGVRNP